MVERWFGATPLIIGPGVRSGMPILYDNPKEVGADRIADAVAGRDLYGIPLVVVDFGTATTFDAVSSRGEYLGGAICPGVEISMNALVASAAALRKVELTPPRGVIGRSTVESMQSGAIYGFGAQADGMVRAFRAELGPETKVIATGGLAAVIAPFCDQIDAVEPWLTLHGLRLLYERNILAR
jgi:type III pantothenate kinase